MSEPFRLFVYGHLRRGRIGCDLLELEQRTEWLGEVQVQGRLYDLGDYPGLVLGHDGTVQGELIAFDDPALWAVLDAYEDCDPDDPAASEYRRIETDLLGGDRAWTYVYNRPVESLAPIASGTWQGV